MSTPAQKLIADIDKLNAEAKPIRDRIAEDTIELAQLRARQARIPEGIARGDVKESAIAENRRRVEILDARIKGNQQLLAPIEARIRELTKQRADEEAEESRRVVREKYERLKREGEERAATITSKILQLVSEDLVRFDEIRFRLASEFEDLGGAEEAMRIFSLLYAHGPFKRAQYHAKLNEEYLHIARLKDRPREDLSCVRDLQKSDSDSMQSVVSEKFSVFFRNASCAQRRRRRSRLREIRRRRVLVPGRLHCERV